MFRWKRQGLQFVGLFAGVLGVYVLLYHFGMLHLEGEAVSPWHSLQVVVETFTTVGYGSDAPWSHPLMNLLVTVMSLTGPVLVFAALPVVVVPLFEAALRTRPPTSLDDISDHVLVCGLSDRSGPLIDQLTAWDVDHAMVVDDRDLATDLHEEGTAVVHGDPQDAEVLRAADADRARAIVADVDDETNASIVLAAREVAPEAEVVTTANDPDDAQYLSYAGADSVLTPRHLLGKSLAEKVTASVSTGFDDGVDLGGDLEIAELPVEEDSEVAGQRLGQSGIRERTGVNVIGAWARGEFTTPLSPHDEVEAGSVLLVAGTEQQVEQLRALLTNGSDRRSGQVVVVGYGEVGRTVTSELAAADVPYVVVDREEFSGVDVVGETTDETVLEAASVGAARSVILAIPDDSKTAFATLVIRELAPEVEVVARADDHAAESKLYRAGADYVLSLATVSGRMLASAVLEEDVITPEKQVEVVKLGVPELAGQSLAQADIRARTGCTVIAIERDGELLTDLGPSEVIQDGDELVVAGSDRDVGQFGGLSH